MYYYKLYGMKIASDIEFCQLVVCLDKKTPDIEILCGDIPHYILEKEKTGCKYEFGEKISWLANRTCYLYIEHGQKLIYQLKKDGLPNYLQTYILGWGMSMIAMQRGIIAMHCSAVADENGAILISGESGSGKSTLTSAFLANGYRLMADDMAWVEDTKQGVIVSPAFPYQKLCRDAAIANGYRPDELYYIDETKDKYLVPYNGEFLIESVPVKGFIMLGITDENEIICEEAVGITKFHMIAGNQFLRTLLGADKYKPVLGQKCLKIASEIPMYYLFRPDGKDTIHELINKAFEISKTFDIR